MGYDAFGLPAENHAIRTGEHPRDSTAKSIASFQRQFRALGHLDRLVARVRHPRAALLPLDAVDLPAAVRARAGLPQARPRSTGARRTRPCSPTSRSSTGSCERCGTRGRGPPARAVVLPHHRLRRPAAGRPRRRSSGPSTSRRCSATGSAAPTAPRSRSAARSWARLPRLHHPPGHAVRRDVLRHGARAPGRASGSRRAPSTRTRSTTYVNRAARETRRGARRHRAREDRRPARPHGHQPGQRRADPDVRRRLRADGVRHRRDHGRARATTSATTSSPTKFGLPIRRVVEGGDELPYTGDGPLVNSDPRFDGTAQPRGARGDRRLARRRRARATARSTTACATGCCRASATGAARSRSSTASAAGCSPCPEDQLPVVLPDVDGLRAAGQVAAGRGRGLGATRRARPAAAPPGARRTRWTRSSTRPGTSCATATPATTRRPGTPRVVNALGAGRPVHRRRRARDPAPDVRALLREGAARPRACSTFEEPFARLFTQGMITRDGAKMSKSKGNMISPQTYVDRYGVDTARCYMMFIGPARPGHRLARRRHRGRAPLPVAAVAAGGELADDGGQRAPERGRRARGRRPRAGAQGALGDRQGHPRHDRAASRSTPRSPR